MSVYRTPTGGRLGFPGPDTRAWASAVVDLSPELAAHLHTVSAGELTASGPATLAPASAFHTHALATGLLTGGGVTLAPAGAFHAHAASEGALTLVFSLAPAGAFHAHVATEGGVTAGDLAPVTSVAADGWTATRRSTAITDRVLDQAFTTSEQGFDGTASPVTWPAEPIALHSRLREQGTSTTSATLGALSRTLLTTSSLVGATNNSTVVAIKPDAAWVHTPDRMRIFSGGSVTLRVVVASIYARKGRQAACVKFILSDHLGGSVSKTIATPTWVQCPNAMPQGAAIGYECFEATFTYSELAALADSEAVNTRVLTGNFEVYPWFGAGASVEKSAENTAEGVKHNGPVRIYKFPASKPPLYAYIQNTASGAPAVSENESTARTNAYGGTTALGAAQTAAIAIDGNTDRLVVRVRSDRANQTLGLPTTSRASRGFPYVIEPDPIDFPSNARISLPWDGNVRPRFIAQSGITDVTRFGYEFHKINFTRTSAALTADSQNVDLVLRNCQMTDNGTGTPIGTNPTRLFIYDTIYSRPNGGTLGNGTNASAFLVFNGCRITAPVGFSLTLESRNVVGCYLDRVGTWRVTQTAAALGNTHWCYNFDYDPQGSRLPTDTAATTAEWKGVNLQHFVCVPVTANIGDVFTMFAGETGTGWAVQVVRDHMLVAGREVVSRVNGPYDVSVDAPRPNLGISNKNAVFCGRRAEKGDIFSLPNNITKTGSRAMSHMVDSEGCTIGSYQEFPTWTAGYGGYDSTPPENSPTDLQFENWNSVTVTGGGTFVAGTRVAVEVTHYRPAVGSPIRTATVVHTNAFDITGNARTSTGWRGPLAA